MSKKKIIKCSSCKNHIIIEAETCEEITQELGYEQSEKGKWKCPKCLEGWESSVINRIKKALTVQVGVFKK